MLHARQVGRRHQDAGEGRPPERRTRGPVYPKEQEEGSSLILKKEGEVPAFRGELDRAVGERVENSPLVSMRSLEIRVLDEIVEKEKELVSVRDSAR